MRERREEGKEVRQPLFEHWNLRASNAGVKRSQSKEVWNFPGYGDFIGGGSVILFVVRSGLELLVKHFGLSNPSSNNPHTLC